jgi:hypothetical protein
MIFTPLLLYTAIFLFTLVVVSEFIFRDKNINAQSVITGYLKTIILLLVAIICAFKGW